MSVKYSLTEAQGEDLPRCAKNADTQNNWKDKEHTNKE
jgi:DNA-binding HxlR family transcriptional regulator